MPWEYELSEKAFKELQKIPKPRVKRLIQAIEVVANDPYKPHNQIKSLSGDLSGMFRLRIGNYRVIYLLDPDTKTMYIRAVLLRNKQTYK